MSDGLIFLSIKKKKSYILLRAIFVEKFKVKDTGFVSSSDGDPHSVAQTGTC